MYLLDNFLGNKQITVVKFDIRHVYKNINKKKLRIFHKNYTQR